MSAVSVLHWKVGPQGQGAYYCHTPGFKGYMAYPEHGWAQQTQSYDEWVELSSRRTFRQKSVKQIRWKVLWEKRKAEEEKTVGLTSFDKDLGKKQRKGRFRKREVCVWRLWDGKSLKGVEKWVDWCGTRGRKWQNMKLKDPNKELTIYLLCLKWECVSFSLYIVN